ncbi:hypothetical protein OH492_22540 [Vibrio chagasii]|nr:hypothetical protein [Vibrio chagasii]
MSDTESDLGLGTVVAMDAPHSDTNVCSIRRKPCVIYTTRGLP